MFKLRLPGVLFLVFVCGCSDPVALPHDDYVLPAPDLSLNPANVVVGELVVSSCHGARPSADPMGILRSNEWTLVDIFFSSQAPSQDGPTAEQLGWVRNVHGRVLYEFNVPAVRARLIGSRIPDLLRSDRFLWVRTVPNAARYDVPLQVTYSTSATPADVELFASLGGRVERVLTFFPTVTGTLPDRSIVDLRRHPDITSVRPDGIACLVVQ